MGKADQPLPQVEVSANCNNPSFPRCANVVGTGGVWVWIEVDADGTADVAGAGCGHIVGRPGGGTYPIRGGRICDPSPQRFRRSEKGSVQMSFERMQMPSGGEPAPPAAAGSTESPAPTGPETPVAIQLQVLATEHWGLLATRSLAWNESFTRAGMFLSALSGGIVALALIAQATSFGDGFVAFALVILPILLFIGLTTTRRIGGSNSYDAMCVVGMNRIRHRYLQLAPEVAPFLVMPGSDDAASLDLAAGRSLGRNLAVEIIVSTPFVLAVINSVIVGVIIAIVGLQLGMSNAAGIAVAILGGMVMIGLQALVAQRAIAGGMRGFKAKFPAP